MGIAASVDYRGDQHSSYLMSSDDENDENAAIVPIGFTPTSSPEQLPDLIERKDTTPDQHNQINKDKEDEAAKESMQPLPNIDDLEMFALQ